MFLILLAVSQEHMCIPPTCSRSATGIGLMHICNVFYRFPLCPLSKKLFKKESRDWELHKVRRDLSTESAACPRSTPALKLVSKLWCLQNACGGAEVPESQMKGNGVHL